MSIAEKITTIAENEQKVFDAGKKAEYDFFWDTLQNKGGEANYENRFWGFLNELYNPKYDFVFSSGSPYSAGGTFRSEWITDIIRNCDFTHLPAGGAGYGLGYTFYNASRLVNARTLKVTKELKYQNPFGGCIALQEIRFEGTIGTDIQFSSCSLLTVESLRSILTALSKDSTVAKGRTITFNTASQAVIEADSECSEQMELARTAGWTIAYA